VTYDTRRYGAFLQDEWRPTQALALNFGIRYDRRRRGKQPGVHAPR